MHLGNDLLPHIVQHDKSYLDLQPKIALQMLETLQRTQLCHRASLLTQLGLCDKLASN